jgi:hypothetical protein
MIDPKQKLTRFGQVYAAATRIANHPQIAFAYRDTAAAESVAQAGALQETDAPTLELLQREFSISSVEELVALARVESRDNTTLLSDAGVDREFVERTRAALAKASGDDEMSDWEQYETFDYAFGFDIDLDAPPPDTDQDLGAAALGVTSSGGAVLPGSALRRPPARR